MGGVLVCRSTGAGGTASAGGVQALVGGNRDLADSRRCTITLQTAASFRSCRPGRQPNGLASLWANTGAHEGLALSPSTKRRRAHCSHAHVAPPHVTGESSHQPSAPKGAHAAPMPARGGGAACPLLTSLPCSSWEAACPGEAPAEIR